MKILSKLDNTEMIEETADKRYVSDAEKLTWNNKSDTDTVTTINGKTGAISKADIVALGIPGDSGPIVDLGTFNSETELITHVLMNQLPTGRYTFIMNKAPFFMLLRKRVTHYNGTFCDDLASIYYFDVSFTGQINELKTIDLRDLGGVGDLDLSHKADITYVDDSLELKADKTYVNSQDALKADKTYVDSKVRTDVPSGAKFTDTITTINGKTGTIVKADIVALGIPSQDTVYTHPSTHPASMITESSTKRFVSDTKISEWDGKETTTGSQSKADTAESNAKDYADAGLADKVDKVTGKGLSTNDYTTTEKNKLSGIETGANNYSHPTSHPASMITGLPTSLPADGGNADTVGGFTVGVNVPANAVFTDTDTITTINGKTGVISKADIVALGIPSQDTVYTHPTGTNPHGTTKSDVGLGNVTNDKQMPISGGVLENYREKLTTVSASNGTINLDLGNVFVHTPSGNRTYSVFAAVPGQAHSFTLIINMGSTVRTLTFPASVKWQGGEIPDLTTASKTYVLTFMTVDGGTNWLGMFGGEF